MKVLEFKTEHSDEVTTLIDSLIEDQDRDILKDIFEKSDAIDFISNDSKYGIIGFFKQQEANEVEKIFKKYGVLFKINDLTRDVFLEKDVHLNKTCPEKVLNLDVFLKKMLNRFREENLNVDIVLEKINDKGIDSLSDKEREILKGS